MVRELGAALAGVVAHEGPQDPAGHALDEVVAVEERAAVDGEEPHERRGRVGGRCRCRCKCARRRVAVEALARTVALDRVRDDRRDCREDRLVERVNATGRSALHREHADELAEREQRHRHRLSPRGSRGPRSPSPERCRPAPRTRAQPDRAYFAICRTLPIRIAAERSAARPMMPSPTRDLRADALGAEPVARDGVEAAAGLVEQEQQRLLVAEQLGQPVDGRGDEHVEVGAAAQAGGECGDRAPSPRPDADVRRRGCVDGDRGRGADPLDVGDAVDVGGAEPEDVLHALSAASASTSSRSRSKTAPRRSVRSYTSGQTELVVRRRVDRAARCRAGSRRGCGPSSRRTGSRGRRARRRPCARVTGT